MTKAADMEERAPGAAETELNELNASAFTAERRVCCLGPLPACTRSPASGPLGGRYASAELPPDPASAAKARRLIRDNLARWHIDDLTDDSQAIASELAANAIAAVPPGNPGLCLVFAIHYRPPELRIIMWDNGPGEPRPAASRQDAETGRGLAIIDHLTGRNWGWWPTPLSGGKVVWAALATTTSTGRRDGGQDSRC